MGKSFFQLIASRFPTYAISYPYELKTRDCIYFRGKFRVRACNLIKFGASTGIKVCLDKICLYLSFYYKVKTFVISTKSLYNLWELSVINLLLKSDSMLSEDIGYHIFHDVSPSILACIGIKANLDTKYIVHKVLNLFFLEHFRETSLIEKRCHLAGRCEIICHKHKPSILIQRLLLIFGSHGYQYIEDREYLWILFPQAINRQCHILLSNKIVELVKFNGDTIYISLNFLEVHIVL